MQGNDITKFHRIKYYKGHTIFKVDKETLEISEAELSQLPMKDGKGNIIKDKKVVMEDGFIYISSLNETNVKKKLIKMGIAVKID